MNRVTLTELARRLCFADHPQHPSVWEPGGKPCARHVRDGSSLWFLSQRDGRDALGVINAAAMDEYGVVVDPVEAVEASTDANPEEVLFDEVTA